MELKIRPSIPEDCEPIHELRNDPAVLQHLFNSEPVTLESHRQWFKATLECPVRFLLSGFFKGQLCGQVRFDLIGSDLKPLPTDASQDQAQSTTKAEVGIFLGKDFFGQGLGPQLLDMAEKDFVQKDHEVSEIYARVIDGNEASKKLFEKCGYKLCEKIENYSLFKKSIE